MRFRYIVLLSLISFTSCVTGKKVTVPSVEVNKLGTKPEGILFLTVFFRQIDDGIRAYDLKAQWTDGHMKMIDVGEGEFSCSIDDDNKQLELFFKNPLSTSFEEYGEGGELQRVEVTLTEAQQTFRINYDGGKRLIKITDRQKQKVIGQFRIE